MNAGSGAVRVALGAGAPPLVVVCAGAVVVVVEAVLVVGAGAAVLVVCETAGGPATDTVLVADPHPPRKAPPKTPSASTTANSRPSLIA